MELMFNNLLPAIYNYMGASNPTMPLNEQYALFCDAMDEEGVSPIPASTYLPFDDSNENTWRIEYGIKRMLAERAKLTSRLRDEECTIAFIWDIDDIAMLSWSHMGEIAFLRPDVDALSLYRFVDKVLMGVDIAHQDEVEAESVENILDVFSDEDRYHGTTYTKLHALKNFYDEFSKKKKTKSVLSHELIEKCGMLERVDELCQIASKVQEIHNQRWKTVKKCLKLVNRRSAKSKDQKYVNLVVTDQGIASATGQLIASGLSSAIEIDKIYSIHHTATETPVWHRIQKRFGEQCVLVYVTSKTVFYFPKDLKVATWTIKANESFQLLYNGLKDLLPK